MKKFSISLIFTFLGCAIYAQSYIGFLTDNNKGVHAVINNPADITGTKFRTDINLVGFSAFFANNVYEFKALELLNDDFDFDTDATATFTDDNNALFNVDVLGPSFMFNLNDKSSIAIFTRARAFFGANEFNGESYENLEDLTDVNTDFMLNEGDFSASANGWIEIGLTYAREIFDKENHYLKGGVSVKYLQGLGSGSLSGRNVTIDYDADGTPLPGGFTTGSLNTTGEITYNRFADFEDDNYDYELPTATGIGFDLGVTYEWRPESNLDDASYKLKAGLSVTDIGSMKYRDGIEDLYDITATVNEDTLNDQDDLDAALALFDIAPQRSLGYNATLPTAIHANVDWNFNNKFYLNLNTDVSIASKTKANANRIANLVSLTPRFETKFFSFYLPLSVVQYSGFQVGAGLRAGPLYIGSGSVLSLVGGESSGADVYAGLKVPIFKSKPKDKDSDGVPNKLDKCPDTAGPAGNNGCPWGDKDNDGVKDNDDACIDVAGAAGNEGCPWGDKDNDGVLDNVDNCVDVAGPIENNGCPWEDADNDGVFDKDDKCVNEAGTVANNGCPEVVEKDITPDVEKTLNSYAKTILFDHARSSIKAESIEVLNDIVALIKEYPKANFVIEGHTDSSGSNTTNQRLSKSRATSIRDFLVENGIDTNRLGVIGYGESKPVASNKTSAGRQLNRRVEINLVN